jgi:translation initiation factor 3 subunit H
MELGKLPRTRNGIPPGKFPFLSPLVKDSELMGSMTENKITSSSILSSLPITISSPSIISAFLESLTTPPAPTQPSLSSPQVPLPPTFSALANPLSTALPQYLQDSLDSITSYNHEANNVAFLVRQMAREKAKHDQSVKDREDDNVRRRKQGLSELPALSSEVRGGTRDPSRLDLLCLQAQVDGLAKDMGDEAGKGLVRCYL